MVWGRSICVVAHIELQPGVEVVVGHNIHLTHLGVHIALNSHQPRKKVSQVQNLDQEVPNLMMVGSPLALAVACA